jgi:hypothetical protein
MPAWRCTLGWHQEPHSGCSTRAGTQERRSGLALGEALEVHLRLAPMATRVALEIHLGWRAWAGTRAGTREGAGPAPGWRLRCTLAGTCEALGLSPGVALVKRRNGTQ